jgi:hypothetical protein
MKNKFDEPVKESKQFQFEHEGRVHNAYVRYYGDGEMDVEITDNNPSDKAYDHAWNVAESLGII